MLKLAAELAGERHTLDGAGNTTGPAATEASCCVPPIDRGRFQGKATAAANRDPALSSGPTPSIICADRMLGEWHGNSSLSGPPPSAWL
jgi:hypothetical protein